MKGYHNYEKWFWQKCDWRDLSRFNNRWNAIGKFFHKYNVISEKYEYRRNFGEIWKKKKKFGIIFGQIRRHAEVKRKYPKGKSMSLTLGEWAQNRTSRQRKFGK